MTGSDSLAARESYRLVVVDDDPVFCLVLSRILSRLGHQVHSAANVASGLDLVLSIDPDLVFSDFDMPDGTGDDLLLAIRQCALTVPVVLVTGVAGLTQTRARFGSGLLAELPTLAATLTKPVDSRSVLQCLTNVLTPSSAVTTTNSEEADQKATGVPSFRSGERLSLCCAARCTITR